MHVPRQENPATHTRRRRRVKKADSAPTPNILEQPVTLSDSVAGIPLSLINSLPIESPAKPQPIVSISRSLVGFKGDSEDFSTLMHILPDSTLKIKRVRVLASVGESGLSTIRVINMETDEELLTETVESEELAVVELSIPEIFSDPLVIQACPGGFPMEIPQIEIWTEIAPVVV